MSNIPDSLLIQYQYDALDRLASCIPAGQLRQDRHYQNGRLATEIQGALQRQIFQGMDVLLAENHMENTLRTSLLMTDKQRSVLQSTYGKSTYTPYGHRAVQGGLTSLLGFNGERRDMSTGHYLLGNGHRAFNPVLMRFNSPDSLSPFGIGGLNCYAYCEGDPVNRRDPTGKWSVHGWFANALLEIVGDYVVPYIPRRWAAWIPGVGNRTFGRVAKGASKIGGVVAAGSYLALNRFDAYAYTEPLYNKLFAAHLAISTVSTISTAASTLHKIARKGVEATPILVRYRSDSLSTISRTVDETSLTSNISSFRQTPFNEASESKVAVTAYEIRKGSR